MKEIIIIGAGIAGLSAGCYGQMNNYSTTIFEMHNLPGGLCTAWKRKGYNIDGCIHWLAGSGPEDNFYNIWHELGAVQNRKFIDHEEFLRIEGNNGERLILYTDIDRLEAHLLELAPEDKERIQAFTRAVKAFTKFRMPVDKAPELAGISDKLRTYYSMLPFMKLFAKYGNQTLTDFASGFTNPFLRDHLHLIFDFPDFPLIAVMTTFAYLHNQCAGFPIGGSLDFSRAIEKRYVELGGKIHYHARVEKILIENDRAVGIRLEDGSVHKADIVISAADGYSTLFTMLGNEYSNEKIRSYYNDLSIFQPLLQISLGINRDFKDEPHAT
ncbi:MAG TPA: FAD-dependent oxidoreductase, partial [Bacteroidales bacterium]